MQQNRIKILIADDNKDFCDSFKNFINSKDDMEVVSTAYDGVEAYSKIIQTKPDIAIIDGIMPRLDGLGVLDKINNANLNPRQRSF